MRILLHYILFLGIVFFFLPKYTANAQYEIPAKMNWWYESRFGMFIHFGSYSYLGHGEWAFYTEGWEKADYQTEVSTPFNPVNFNAETIVSLAKNAGMKYLVITAKHHEGFCMWHTGVESFIDVTGMIPYNLYDFTVFKRDILQELKDECDEQGVKFCLYYSILDWNHPSQTALNWFSVMASQEARTNYINDMKVQLAELVNSYHPAVLWFDGDWCGNQIPTTLADWWNKNDAQQLYDYLIDLDSTLIINERVKRDFGLGDFECPEQEVPDAPLSRQWETCQTMNYAWGYNENNESSYKSASTLIRELVQVVSRDGNYLLNIGPKGDGSVTSGATTILNGFANWMDTYSESIYGTTRSPYPSEPSWGYYTKKEGRLYIHIFSWPGSGKLQIPDLVNTIDRIYMLNDTLTDLTYEVTGGAIDISLPPSRPNSINSVLVVAVTGVPKSDESTTTGLQESETTGLVKIFPNPSSGRITITFDKPGAGFLELCSLSGKIIHSQELIAGNKTINIDLKDAGFYIIKICYEGSVITEKITIR